MKLKSLLQSSPLPDRDLFFERLHQDLFKQPVPTTHRWRWLSLTAVGAVILSIIAFSLKPPSGTDGLALAAALSNTLASTHSTELIQQTVTTERKLGLAEHSTAGETRDEHGEIVPPSTKSYDVGTMYILGNNVRLDGTHEDDQGSYQASTLNSSLDGVYCSWSSLDRANPTCSDLHSDIPFEAMHNDNTWEFVNLTVKNTGSEQGDIELTWELSGELDLESGSLSVSNGPSGYAQSWYQPRSWHEGDKTMYAVNLHSEDIHLNASNAFYPDRSGQVDIQLTDTTGGSSVYLLDIDQLTAAPVSDTTLIIQQTEFENLMQDYNSSTERLQQDIDLILGNIYYLKDHLDDLHLENSTANSKGIITETYSVPEKLALYAGTNQALVATASFKIDPTDQRITSYTFMDKANNNIESVTIERKILTDHPATIFGKEQWMTSVVD